MYNFGNAKKAKKHNYEPINRSHIIDNSSKEQKLHYYEDREEAIYNVRHNRRYEEERSFQMKPMDRMDINNTYQKSPSDHLYINTGSSDRRRRRDLEES